LYSAKELVNGPLDYSSTAFRRNPCEWFFCTPVSAFPSLRPTFSAALGIFIVLAELRIRKLSLKTLIGAAIGSILGIIGASLISIVIARMNLDPHTGTFAQALVLILMAYVGLVSAPRRAST